MSALEEAAASSPRLKNLAVLFEQEKAKSREVQGRRGAGGATGSGAGAGGSSSSSKLAEKLSGVGKGIGKRSMERDDGSKGKGVGKEGEKKKGFFQRKSEELLAREMQQAKPSPWRPIG